MKTHIIVPFEGYHESPPLVGVLRAAQQTGWPLVFIARPDNKKVIEYVQTLKLKYSFQAEWVLGKSARAWPESVLLSQPYWADANLLMLPDTDLEPSTLVVDIVNNLKRFDISYGLFDNINIQGHGLVEICEKQIHICDRYDKTEHLFLPWGLLAFKKTVGKMLFESMMSASADHEIKTLPFKAQSISLNN